MADRITITRPFPGPVMVRCDPPRIETTIPPAMAAIIPAIGGASEAIAKPKPKGNAINETTNPEKIFLGRSPINCLKVAALVIVSGVND
jgi:hypothetical protein